VNGSTTSSRDRQSSAGSQWESAPRTLFAVVAVGLLVLVGIYWLAAPIVVRGLAARVPHAALEAIGRETLAALDRSLLQPTSLPPERRQSIGTAFGRLSIAPELKSVARLEFRRSADLGANALALPSGTIVVTDGLVDLAQHDDDVVAVLAHEVGHLDGRHGVRAVIQDAFLSTLIALIAGDVSSLAAAAPAALLNARYSRSLEREADAYAVTTLRASGIRATRLADMLERMEAEQARAGRTGPAGAFQYLSTHPTTDERLRTLRAESAQEAVR
jgi:Zn-dependent protease with chaperone function